MADLEVVAVPTTPEGVLCRAADYYTQEARLDPRATTAWPRKVRASSARACGPWVSIRWQYDEGADDLPPLVVQAAERLAERLDLEPFDIAQCLVVEWNDSECKSKEQAVSVLRAAAGGCKEAGGG
jgi:hypothetical protein